MINEVYIEKPLAVVAGSSSTDSYAVAKQFAEHGYDLIIAASNPSVVEEAEDLKEYGVDAVSYQLDLSSHEGVEQLYKRIVATGRPIEAIVINTNLSHNHESEFELATSMVHYMDDHGNGRIFFTPANEDHTLLFEKIKIKAVGTRVRVSTLPSSSSKIFH